MSEHIYYPLADEHEKRDKYCYLNKYEFVTFIIVIWYFIYEKECQSMKNSRNKGMVSDVINCDVFINFINVVFINVVMFA